MFFSLAVFVSITQSIELLFNCDSFEAHLSLTKVQTFTDKISHFYFNRIRENVLCPRFQPFLIGCFLLLY